MYDPEFESRASVHKHVIVLANDHWHDCGLISQGLLLICIAMGLISTQVFILCLIACLKDIRELKDQRDLLEFELEEMSQLSVS